MHDHIDSALPPSLRPDCGTWYTILAGSKSPTRHSAAKAPWPAGNQCYGDGA
jgi:hypothetical protein